MKILLVEDDTFIRELYEEIFADEGFIVDAAADGQAGLEKMQSDDYDVILLDIMMPQKDGLQVLRDLGPGFIAKATIIMLTNLGQDKIVQDSLKLGAKGYLIKSSMSPDEVVTEVKKFLPTQND